MTRAEKALEYHKKGYNCSQAVACAFCDKMNVDEATVFKMMEGFGFGIGDSYGTCGAVSGMAAVLGMVVSSGNLACPDSKQKTYAKVRELSARFREMNGSTICRDLKGMDNGNALRSCDDCIADAAQLLAEELGE